MDVRVNVAEAYSLFDDQGRARLAELYWKADKNREQRVEEAQLASSIIRRFIKFRSQKRDLFPEVNFSDPAWDIILDLTAAKIERKTISVSSVCIAASAPPTTALRWVNQLCDAGILMRRKDELDALRSVVEIAPEAFQAVISYLVKAYV